MLNLVRIDSVSALLHLPAHFLVTTGMIRLRSIDTRIVALVTKNKASTRDHDMATI